jgi:hypothetical protein
VTRRGGAEPDALPWPVDLDPAVLAILVVSLLMMVGALVAVGLDPDARSSFGWVLALTLGTFGLVGALTLPTRYRLTLEALEVQAGLVRYRMAWPDVVRVSLAWSPVSSTTASWSFRRVRLVAADGRTLEVAPRDRIGFVAEVLARAPQLAPESTSAGPSRVWVDHPRERRRDPRRAL